MCVFFLPFPLPKTCFPSSSLHLFWSQELTKAAIRHKQNPINQRREKSHQRLPTQVYHSLHINNHSFPHSCKIAAILINNEQTSSYHSLLFSRTPFLISARCWWCVPQPELEIKLLVPVAGKGRGRGLFHFGGITERRIGEYCRPPLHLKIVGGGASIS